MSAPAEVRRFGNSNRVAPERSGFRDEAISRRHRDYYGTDCPMVDGDFIVTEYENGKANAVIDYKSCDRGNPKAISPANVAALCSLGHPALLPVAVLYYWPDTWAFVAVPLNPAANEVFAPRCEWLTERQYVRRILALRGIEPERARNVRWPDLRDEEPPVVAREWFGGPSRPLPAPGNLFRYTNPMSLRMGESAGREVELIPVRSMPPVVSFGEQGAESVQAKPITPRRTEALFFQSVRVREVDGKFIDDNGHDPDHPRFGKDGALMYAEWEKGRR